MPGKLSRYGVRLNAKQRRRLEAVIRRRSPQHWMVERAKIVLLSHRGLRIIEICAALCRWTTKSFAGGSNGSATADSTRSGIGVGRVGLR
jgi:hypothetical protein